MIIFAAQNHQSNWYIELPKSWTIGTSKNSWTTDKLEMCWLKDVFNKHIKVYTAGRYCLLILNNYSSHASAEFDQFCTENMIIPLYLLSYLLYLL